MESKIISSVIRHTVTFAPNTERPAYPTDSIFVEARDVSRLETIPVTKVQVGDDTLTLESKPFNNGFHHVEWGIEGSGRAKDTDHIEYVAVPRHLAAKVRVYKPAQRARAA
jgi:hypothetical protein